MQYAKNSDVFYELLTNGLAKKREVSINLMAFVLMARAPEATNSLSSGTETKKPIEALND